MENIYPPYPKTSQVNAKNTPKKEVLDFLLGFSAALQISSSNKIGKLEILMN
jgi:hypothetical protein